MSLLFQKQIICARIHFISFLNEVRHHELLIESTDINSQHFSRRHRDWISWLLFVPSCSSTDCRDNWSVPPFSSADISRHHQLWTPWLFQLIWAVIISCRRHFNFPGAFFPYSSWYQLLILITMMSNSFQNTLGNAMDWLPNFKQCERNFLNLFCRRHGIKHYLRHFPNISICLYYFMPLYTWTILYSL